MIGIVVSRDDSASVHVGERLLELGDWERTTDDSRPDAEGGGDVYRTEGFELRSFDALHIDLESAADPFAAPDYLVFVSRHAGDTGALLTAHVTGNFGHAEYGGEGYTVARAPPNAHATVVAALREHAPDGYDVGMECTHHGPTGVPVPSMFVELGSGEAQWDDPAGARAVARAVLDLRGVAPHRERQLVGFGGGHYAPRFERVVAETDWAVGHVAADWCLADMGDPDAHRDVVAQAFERSGATHALVEGDHPALVAVLEDLGYRVVSETWLRESSGVPLAFVRAAEDALGPVEAGLRFGEPAAGYGGDFEVLALPETFVAAVERVDRERALAVVREHALAYETEERGNRLGDRALVADAAAREALVEGLTDLLVAGYDSVEPEDGAVVVREEAFDPEKAATLGVSEGPAYGELARGRPVEVGSREITPEMVRSEESERLKLPKPVRRASDEGTTEGKDN
ncbi:MAG: D-aminoacyl-tRNA deacylase [Haloarculaceae archaeon]